MPEQLATADGQKIDLDDTDRAFAAAMAAPTSAEPEAPAPPRREPVDPEAPFGRRLDGAPKKSRGGRPPKAREIQAPRAPEGTKPAAAPPDYTGLLSEFTDALWMVLAATPVPWPDVRIKVRAQAFVLRANQGGVVQGVNAMAQHNGTIRWGVEKLTAGSAGWVLPAVMALAPFAVQSGMIWRAPPNGDMERLAAQTEQQWAEKFAAMKADFAEEILLAEQLAEQDTTAAA